MPSLEFWGNAPKRKHMHTYAHYFLPLPPLTLQQSGPWRSGSISLDEFHRWSLSAASVASGCGVRNLFRKYDADGSGLIDEREFCAACRDIGFAEYAHALFELMPLNADRTFNYHRLVDAIVDSSHGGSQPNLLTQQLLQPSASSLLGADFPATEEGGEPISLPSSTSPSTTGRHTSSSSGMVSRTPSKRWGSQRAVMAMATSDQAREHSQRMRALLSALAWNTTNDVDEIDVSSWRPIIATTAEETRHQLAERCDEHHGAFTLCADASCA